MTDRKKVIKGLHCCSHTDGVNCIYCPYDNKDTDCTALMAMDVLALLKEQEPVPVTQREVMHMLVWCCGSCGVAITDGDKFCRMCGRAVKWE